MTQEVVTERDSSPASVLAGVLGVASVVVGVVPGLLVLIRTGAAA
ncbi:MAG: hypothetical protein SFV15_08785 [Polyangiaceae bacterium]|nr:hypothetical protein [Polyangiaceae bacterium]